jgi:HSP20 family molecular chaperone IbpA
MEKIKSVTDRAEDPFYRLKSLDPVLTENESAYVIAVRLPPHEADNLFVSGEGPYLKLSLARRYQDNAKSEAGDRSTKTSSYQSVVEQIAMPGPYEARKIERKYENGVVSITVPKQIFRQTIT